MKNGISFWSPAAVYPALRYGAGMAVLLLCGQAQAATSLPFTVNMSEAVDVSGCPATCPRIAVDVGGVTRYAEYSAGSGTATLTFTYDMVAGDVDLDGVTVSSPVDLNGGSITDLNGNAIADLTFTPPNTANVKVNYPSLGMDFVYDADGRYTRNGTAYNDLSSFLTATGGAFSRNSVGTYFDSTGTLQTAAAHTPRFDHDPVTHAAKGILIEEQRTNLLTRSSEFDNGVWVKNNVTITANVTTAPDGTMTAEKLVEGATLNSHLVVQSTVTTAGTSYTFSVYAKASERSFVQIRYENTGSTVGYAININLSTGAYTQLLMGGPTGTSARVTNVGNGWYRCTITVDSNNAGFKSIVYTQQVQGTNSYMGDGVSGIYVWGAQLEQGSFPTSYIPATNAAVTRVADNLTIPTGGWYNQSAGTVYDDVAWRTSLGPVSWPNFWHINDGTVSNRWYSVYYRGGAGEIDLGGSFLGTYQGGYANASPAEGDKKTAFAQELNNLNSSFNGNIGLADNSWTPPPVTQLLLTTGGASVWHEKLKYYPARVSDAQLQLLTQ